MAGRRLGRKVNGTRWPRPTLCAGKRTAGDRGRSIAASPRRSWRRSIDHGHQTPPELSRWCTVICADGSDKRAAAGRSGGCRAADLPKWWPTFGTLLFSAGALLSISNSISPHSHPVASTRGGFLKGVPQGERVSVACFGDLEDVRWETEYRIFKARLLSTARAFDRM